MAVASGWMERAASLLGDAEECAGHGWLVLDRAPFTDDAEERQRLATVALAIARPSPPPSSSGQRFAATNPTSPTCTLEWQFWDAKRRI